jgi:hypothetical protein
VDEQPEFDEAVPEELSLPEVDTPMGTIYELAAFIAQAMGEEERMTALAKDYLDRLYAEFPNEEEAASAVISYIQSRHKWDVELLAEKSEVEQIFYEEYSYFDDDIWEKVMNTDAISELHHQVHSISVAYIKEAIEEVLDGIEEAD